MNTSDRNKKQSHKPEQDMPHRVAPRLKAVVKNLGNLKNRAKKKKK